MVRRGVRGVQSETALDRERDCLLLHRVATGDSSALREVCARHGRSTKASAARILGRSSATEDVVQETCIELWRRAPQFDGRRGGVSAWLSTIARSRAIDSLRAGQAEIRKITAAATQLVPEPISMPDEILHRRRVRSEVREALHTLPAAQRGAILLGYYEGLSQTEIADKTGTPVGTVKMRTRAGIEKLARRLSAFR